MPMKLASGRCVRKAAIRCAPNRSPDASPATMPMVSIPAFTSTHDPAGGALQKVGEHADFRTSLGLLGKRGSGLIQRQAGFVQGLVRAFDPGERFRGEAAAAQA